MTLKKLVYLGEPFMGTIPRVSELSGQKYEFTIAGDEPTVDDLRRMDAIIRKDDAEFAQYFEEKYDMSATPVRVRV
jgi:hypothetical protein